MPVCLSHTTVEVDTEGHDVHVLDSLLEHAAAVGPAVLPRQIAFPSPATHAILIQLIQGRPEEQCSLYTEIRHF